MSAEQLDGGKERELTRVARVPRDVLDRASVTHEMTDARLSLHIEQPDRLVSTGGGLHASMRVSERSRRCERTRRTRNWSSFDHARSKMAF